MSSQPLAEFLPSPTSSAIIISALTIVLSIAYISHYQPYIERVPMASTISDKVFNWCTTTPSIIDVLGKDPSKGAGTVAKQLFGKGAVTIGEKERESSSNVDHTSQTSSHPSGSEKAKALLNDPTEEDLNRALQCGKFGDTRPTELFLRMWHDSLVTLEHDPMGGVVSPSLMGSTGTIPLTIVGVVWDICRHMSNLIVRAEKEIFFSTNYWGASGASMLITDAIVELNRRAGQRQEKVVVKILYDRGSLKQLAENHLIVPSSNYTSKALKIPDPKDIPNIDLEVMNFHTPLLGTFHSKFMVVDREIGVVCSCNVQENDNLEMMTHVEGPIVDSLYDTLLYSWHVPFEPSLPRMHNPTSTLKYSSFNDESFKKLFNEDGTLIHEASLEMPNGEVSARLPPHDPSAPHYDESIAGEFIRMRSTLVARSPDTHISLVNQHLNRATNANRPATVPEPSSVTDYFSPYIPHPPHRPFPVALVNRKPAGAPNNASLHVPQNAAWISGLRNAKKNVFIQTPNLNAKALLPEMIKAVKRGVEVEFWVCLGYNDAGEMLPAQGGQNDLISKKLVDELKGESEEIRKLLKAGWYVAKDQDKPIHKMEQGRCCHVKIMIVDDQVGIQGSGNQDTQSWYHSQEVNIMIDSKMICESWRDALHRNQNTHLYGMGSAEDGQWRDAKGKMAKHAIGPDAGHLSWAKGVLGAIQRVRGKGGF